jgi:fatty-acyl-CoA synthase
MVERFGDREAIVCCHHGQRLSYADLSRRVDAVAKGLMALGFTTGDRIGVWSTDNLEWLLLQLATARIGAILVNINPAYRPRELAYALERSEVQGLFAIPAFSHSHYADMLADLLPQLRTVTARAGSERTLDDQSLPHMRHVIVWDPENPAQTAPPYPGMIAWQDMMAAGENFSQAALDGMTEALDADDPINIQYTSGTTGFPKAVLLSHHNILNNAWFTAHAMQFDENDRLCVPVPFYHCFGMVLSNLLCLSVGACMVVPAEHFDPLATLQAIAAERCTALHGVPTMFIAQLEHPRFSEFDLSSLRTGIMAGAPCPPELMRRVMKDMHCREVLIGYGQTEASPITHLTTRDDSIERRTETVGRNLPHQEVKIADRETGHALPLGDVGEVCFRGYHVMPGYYGDDKATAATIDAARWLHSGDLGTMDKDGYVRITGRLKEMIIRGGENIYPAEIETYIFTHPKVAQAAVFGVPDEAMGEEVMAWVQLHAGEDMDASEFKAFCKEGLSHFKVPRYVRFVDEFPMTITGKLQKFKMQEFEAKERQTAA